MHVLVVAAAWLIHRAVAADLEWMSAVNAGTVECAVVEL